MNLPTKVLVVDDELIIREVMRMVLEDKSYHVLTAEDGEEGWQIFLEERPDVVLSDLNMPNVDGFELVSRIVKEDQEVPIIIFSGVGTMENILKALELGAWDYLTKPITDNNVLIHVLTKALERRELIRSVKSYQGLLEESVRKRIIDFEEEINTSTQSVSSNVDFLDKASRDIIDLMANIELIAREQPEKSAEKIRLALKKKNWEFLAEEIPLTIQRFRDGIDKISSLVTNE